MGLFSAIGGLIGGNKAASKYDDRLTELAEQNKYSPFDVSGPLGSGIFQGNKGTATLSPDLQKSFDQFGSIAGGLGTRASNFDSRNFQNEYFDAIDKLESRREADQFNSFESKVFNSGGVHTGTGRMVADFQRDLEDARYSRSMKAVTASQDFFTNMLNQLLGVEQGRLAIGASALDPLKAGANFGQIAGSQNLDAAKLSAEGAGIKFGAKANTAKAIGGIFDDAAGAFATGGFSGFGKNFFGG